MVEDTLLIKSLEAIKFDFTINEGQEKDEILSKKIEQDFNG